MYLAKKNGKFIIGTQKGYKFLEDFSWNSFNWSSNGLGEIIDDNNILESINEFPVHDKGKIICVGRNYVDHAKELGNEIPEQPLLFWKPNSSLLAPKGKIKLPNESKNVQFETELIVVIGKKGHFIKEKNAMDYVLGFTIGLDITARDLQRSDKTWFRGKSFDTFSPVGPVIVPKENLNLDDCRIKLFINDKIRQDGNTKDFIFKLPMLISYISQIITLEPGDIIYTGTPEGVDRIYSGDKLVAEIKGIGILKVYVE